MVKQFAALVALLVVGLLAAAQVGAIGTVTAITVFPDSPIFDANNIVGVAGDAAPGFPIGSFASNGVAKTDMYFPPSHLFGREVLLGEVAAISYWTKTGSNHVADFRDWFLAIYTKPYAGDVSTPGWYGTRIGSEPYFSESLDDPAGTWNRWTTDGPDNWLRFFESTAGAPGANFGSYSDPHWAQFVAGGALGSAVPYAGQEVLFFTVQTGSAWAAGFTGQLDGLRIELTDGSIATVNFDVQVTKADCKKGGWQSLGFKNQGQCIQFVNTGK